MLRPRRLAEAALCLALLALHFATRMQASERAGLAGHAFYGTDYQVALSLNLGRGFRGFDLDSDERPPARAVRSFFEQRRGELPARVLRRFAPDARPVAPPALATTRILELRLAALLWKAFGTRWDVVFAFYAGLSTLVAGLVFLMAARLAGRLAGWTALVLFLASPMEAFGATARIRDVSPAWFDSIALAALLWLTPPRWPARRLAAGCFAVGAVSVLGYGWRTDALLMPGLALLALLARLVAAGVPLRTQAPAAAALVAGALAAFLGIGALGGEAALSPNIGFHIATYGNATRANLAGVENSFQSLRDDAQTVMDVSYHAGRPLLYGTPEYTLACRDAYFTTLRYGLYSWLRVFPTVFFASLGGLGDPGTLQGQSAEALRHHRIPELAPAYRYLLDPLTALAPALFVVGAVALLLGSDAWAGALLPVFALVYSGVLLLVLPESKHVGPLLPVTAVVAGAGLASLLRWRRGRPLGLEAPRWRRALGMLGALVAAWAVAVAGAYFLSRHERRAYLDEIRQRARDARPSPGVLGPRLFSAAVPPGAAADPMGYLVTIRAGSQPALVVTHHRRGSGDQPTQRHYVNRSPLLPSREQTLFVLCLQGGRFGDPRTHVCTARIEGDARIVAAREVGLAGWARPVFSTVFSDEDAWAGNPRLGPGVAATEYRGIPRDGIDELGLRPAEAIQAGAPSARLIAPRRGGS
ncbi:MAG: hypothetical protein AB7O37_12600 [Vicinamibacteria bacterium]